MKQESLKFSGRASNPATRKFSPAQIAAQKLFAERARAGTLGKGKRKAVVKRKANPDKSKPRTYVKRASQATGAPPSKRLLTRRKKALSAPAGYFPNPRVKKLKKYYQVSIMQDGLHTKFMGLANFFTFSEAENYANHLAKQHKNWTSRVHDIRAM
jgi:hypothetical protein